MLNTKPLPFRVAWALFSLQRVILVMVPSPTTKVGLRSEQITRRLLAKEGINAQTGWNAYGLGRVVRLDLVDVEKRNIYEVKTGPVFHIVGSTATRLDQAERQAALIGKSVRLKNFRTRDEITQFLVSSVTWISVGAEGKAGFGPKAAERLSALGIMMRTLGSRQLSFNNGL